MSPVYVLGPGGQYNHLIARRITELGYDAKIRPVNTRWETLSDATALIIGGGPGRLGLGEPESLTLSETVEKCGVPVLGICYGHQFLVKMFGGTVVESETPEFGPARLRVLRRDELFNSVPDEFDVWMSHNDDVQSVPRKFLVLAVSQNSKFQAVKKAGSSVYGVQFHVEVEHTHYGSQILSNFVSLSKR